MERQILTTEQQDECDFALLEPLTEETFIKNLSSRFKQDLIYTYIGYDLVSVNPFKKLDIYSSAIAKLYFTKGRVELPPHIFGVITTAYQWLINRNMDQCIILSGETGSGKTEAINLIYKFLSYVCPCSVVSQIQSAISVLESFGNAQTVNNDNSSRFGKYIQLEFDFRGVGISGHIVTYMLEKWKVTERHALGERNFHIFYDLLCGADISLLKLLKLQRYPGYYNFLSGHVATSSSKSKDELRFRILKSSFEKLQFSSDIIIEIFKVVSIILKLGNLRFSSTTNIDGTEGCAVVNDHELYEICELLKIDVDFFQRALRFHTVHMSSNCSTPEIMIELQADEAMESRNILCQALYNRLFIFIVKSINQILKAQPESKKKILSSLDFPGFEKSNISDLYDLMKNSVNERLLNTMLDYNIRCKQEEYAIEGIEWIPLDYYHNDHICQLIEKMNDGIFSTLDDACNQRTIFMENNLITKMCQLSRNFNIRCESISSRSRPNSPSSNKLENTFTIQHYAGTVTYDVNNFVKKNKDLFRRDLSVVMYHCQHPLMKILFPEGDAKQLCIVKQSNTICKQVRICLSNLMCNIQKKYVHYVHCIRPNDFKSPRITQHDVIQQQIIYESLVEIARMRRNGYCDSFSHDAFLNRYKMLSRCTWPNSRLPVIQALQYLLHDLQIPMAEFKFGTTKLFIRSPRAMFDLEELRNNGLEEIVIILQKTWKGYYWRKKFDHLKYSQKIISIAWREYKILKEKKKVEMLEKEKWAAQVIRRSYVQWKRYEFLIALSVLLSSPRTLSPLNRDWHPCTLPLVQTSIILRRIHHRWRCDRYRERFDHVARNKMREKVTASLLFKDKKCSYKESISYPFIGDYVRLRQNSQWKKICTPGNDQYIVFADTVNKITRSSGKFVPTLLVISTKSVLILDQRTLDIKYRIPANDIYRLSLSPFFDNVAVFHVKPTDEILKGHSEGGDKWSNASSSNNEQRLLGCATFLGNSSCKKGDLILHTHRIIEAITKLYLVVQNAVYSPPEISIAAQFNACFNQQMVSVSFHCVGSPEIVPGQMKIIRKGDRIDILL